MEDVLRPTVASVRRLVRALVADGHAADDLAQDAWLEALQKRVAGPGLGRRLFGAARRLARSGRRDAVRRLEREERAPRSGAGPSSARARPAVVQLFTVGEDERVELDFHLP